jgi:hypothetical protein
MPCPERAKRVEGSAPTIFVSTFANFVLQTLIRPSNFALRISPISPSFPRPKPAKTLQKPTKNPHFPHPPRAPISAPTPAPITPYIHSLPQSTVHTTFFPNPSQPPGGILHYRSARQSAPNPANPHRPTQKAQNEPNAPPRPTQHSALRTQHNTHPPSG